MATEALVLESLEITDVAAKKVVKLGIENGAYSDDMPGDKKARAEAALETVNFCIDSWVNDGIRPDDDDEDVAAAGDAILSIFKAAGIEVEEDGGLVLPGQEEEEEESEEDEEESEGEGDEAPFDPDDYIEGYSELTWKEKLAALKDLDLEDEDTLGVVTAIYQWEKEQDKPSSRVCNWVEENVEISEAEEEEEETEEEGEEKETEAEESEEPWDGYDKLTAANVRSSLAEEFKAGNLGPDEIAYIREYEKGTKNRSNVFKRLDELVAQLDAPEKPKAKGGALASRKAGKAATTTSSNGAIVLTRDQILEALSEGSVALG